MKPEILIKINNFIKNRLIELSGVSLILISIFLLGSIVSYSPSDPNFIYMPENTEIKNIGGFYGSVISDFLLQSLGLMSIFLVINFFYWGLKLVTEKTILQMKEISNKVDAEFILIILDWSNRFTKDHYESFFKKNE